MNQYNSGRVLLIDESKYFIKYLKGHLLARNYEIAGEAQDCQQALQLFKAENPDLTLLDFNMPNTNGIEILQKILAQDSDAVVIMLIENSNIETMQLCLDKGAFYCIGKDYPLETIFSVIEVSFKEIAAIRKLTACLTGVLSNF